MVKLRCEDFIILEAMMVMNKLFLTSDKHKTWPS